jgi:hypothetical protein
VEFVERVRSQPDREEESEQSGDQRLQRDVRR